MSRHVLDRSENELQLLKLLKMTPLIVVVLASLLS